MKKWILGILVLAIIVTAGISFVKAYGVIGNTDNFGFFKYGMMGSGYCYDELDESDENDYEWLYLHLNEDNQTLIDQMYAENLATYDLSQMSDEEKADAIATVKAYLVEYIIDNDLVGLW